MKNKLLVFFFVVSVLIFATQETFAQDTRMGYTYMENGLSEVPVRQDVVLVYFKTRQISIFEIHRHFECYRTVVLSDGKSDSLYAVEVAVDSDYAECLYDLKKRSDVFDVEPVLGVNGRYPVSNMFYVKLKREDDTSLLKNVAANYSVSVNRQVPYSGLWYELSVSKNSFSNALVVSTEFGKTELFAAVDPGVIFEVQPFDLPCVTDNMFNYQWGLEAIEACDAWQITTGDTSVHVAVIDGGVDITHQEFSNLNIAASYNSLTGTSPATLFSGHGSRVAGVIFSGHNNYSVAGVAPDASLINISDPLGLLEDVSPRMVSAFGYAVAHDADVFNCSWGTIYDEELLIFPVILLNDAINNVLTNGRNGKGCVVVFSSGNYLGDEPSSIRYPANMVDGVLAVGSVGSTLSRASNSCYGEKMDVVAPGVDIYTTGENNQYPLANGTSFAAPHVAGVAALMLSVNHNMTNKQVTRIIDGTATKLTNYALTYDATHVYGGWNEEVGYGLLNAAAAVQSAQNLAMQDLYVRDNLYDDGTEYNYSNSSVNNSPDIKVCSVTTGNEVTDLHYGVQYVIKVTLHNDRNSSVNISPSKIKVYWTVETNNIQWRNTWDNAGLSYCGLPLCGIASSSQQTSIVVPANGCVDISIPFTAPVFSTTSCWIFPEPQSLSMVAVIDDGNLIIGETDYAMPIEMFVRANNNVAWHNYTMSDGIVAPFDPIIPKSGILDVSPNPSNGRFLVEVAPDFQGERIAIVVVSPLGYIVRREEFANRQRSIELDGLQSGTYSVYLLSFGHPVDVATLIVN